MTGELSQRMVELVLSGAKAVLIVLIVLAVLYVLISPLPEMAATNSLRYLPFLISLLFSILVLGLTPVHCPVSGTQSILGHGVSRSRLCTRLC